MCGNLSGQYHGWCPQEAGCFCPPSHILLNLLTYVLKSSHALVLGEGVIWYNLWLLFLIKIAHWQATTSSSYFSQVPRINMYQSQTSFHPLLLRVHITLVFHWCNHHYFHTFLCNISLLTPMLDCKLFRAWPICALLTTISPGTVIVDVT